MPKENKKRGRREEKKRKREEEAEVETSKRQKSQDVVAGLRVDNGPEGGPQVQEEDTTTRPGELPFYGMLDEEEQEYFKRADGMLEANQFGDAEERDLFLANVYKEAYGKELKIANSQSCSRLMERLILRSTPEQLKAIFQKFSGHFLNLVQHRFGSHCCEALFLRAAPMVTQELKAAATVSETEVHVSMENCFLFTVNELEPHLGFLMSDLFASHPLRVLLVVLSGMALASPDTTIMLQSKRKENVSIENDPSISIKDSARRLVPVSFHEAVDKILKSTLAFLDTTSIRALASQPIANPVLQLLLELELTRAGKQSAKDPQSLFHRLLPDDQLVDGSESAQFVQHLLYNRVGSRLLEVLITHAPGKTFKALYKGLFKDKLGTIAKNETAAFVVIKLIERLSRDDLESAVGQICHHIDTLIKRSRTAVIKILIERCRVREIDTQPIADALQQFHGSQISRQLIDMLGVGFSATDNMSAERKKQLESQDVGKIHASLLAQTMLQAPGPLRELFNNSLLGIPPPELKTLAKDRTASRVIQAALTCKDQSLKFRRQFVPLFISLVPDLAMDAVASHVVDALWAGSSGLKFLRQRIAVELLSNETLLRESVPGRAVWRNWKMDLYKGGRTEWSDFESGGQIQIAKTGIQLARERHSGRKSLAQSVGLQKVPLRSKVMIDGKA